MRKNPWATRRAWAARALICTIVTVATGCSAMPFVAPAKVRLGTETTSVTPAESKRHVQDELWNAANLIGGLWTLAFSPIPYHCTTADGDDGARYRGVLRLQDPISPDNFREVADAIATHWKSRGFHVKRAAYTPDSRIVMADDRFGTELSYTREMSSTVLISAGPCVPTDYKKLRFQDGEELDRTGTPIPTAPAHG
jgi:hypothetical protein